MDTLINIVTLVASLLIIFGFVALTIGAVEKRREAKRRVQQLEEVTEFIKNIGLSVGDQPTMPDECECGCKHSESGVTPWYVELGPDGHD